jgi:hypothetical protein
MTGSRISIASLLLGGALLTFAPAALAEPTDQEKSRARELMAEGREKRDKSDMMGALDAFTKADGIMHVPTTALEVARTQQAMGKLVEARETVDAIAKAPVLPSDPPPFAEARAKAEALGRDLDKQIPQLKLAYKGTKPTSVTIDDVAVANPDAPARVNPGKHVVAAHGGEEGDAHANISVAAGETKEVDITLHKAASAAAPPPEEPKSGFKIPTLSLVGFGVGAAGIVVGSIFGIMTMSAESDLSGHCPNKSKCNPQYKDDLDSAKTKATISTVGFIVGGVGVAVGIVGFVIQPKTEAKVGAVTFDYTKLRGTF